MRRNPELHWFAEQDSFQAAAAGRSQTAQAGHHQGKKTPEVGTQGEARRRPDRHDCVFSNEGLKARELVND
jgi:hypothetical protein